MPIDFFDWIKTVAVHSAEPISHWELIRLVADKMGAHPETALPEILRSCRVRFDGGANLGVLVPALRSYGRLTLHIAKDLLKIPVDVGETRQTPSDS